MTDPMTRFQRLQQRYRDGNIPWDHDLPPPEVIAVAAELPPGRVLDLGCGTARVRLSGSAGMGGGWRRFRA